MIDVHAHAVPRAMLEAIEREPDRFGATFEHDRDDRYIVMKGRRVGPIVPEWFDAERRIADMDAAGIDVQVLSPLPTLFFYWGEREWAAEIAALMNESIAAMAGESERFWALGQLPLQSPEHSLRELERIRELGLPGVEIGANVIERELDDASLEPVWARIDELGLAVFVHPLNPSLLTRMEPYHLTNLIGNPLDTTIALCRLILSGALLRYPRIRFYFAHAGGFVPYLYGRIDHAWHARDDTKADLGVLPSSFLSSVWFDTITHAGPPLRYLIDAMGADRVVVGTDYPADMSDTGIGTKLDALDLSADVRSRVARENAFELFASSSMA